MAKLLAQTNLKPDYWHSMLISLLRGLAALQVAAAHLRAQLYPGYQQIEAPSRAFQAFAFVTGFAHLAVVVFFVLSGWLVGGSLLNKIRDDRALRDYAIDRTTRLWIVLVPVLGIGLLCGLLKGALDGGHVDLGFKGEYSLGAFLGNLVGLQHMVVLPFGGNFALWSLANETWYYVMFPLLIVLLRGQGIFSRVLSAIGLITIVNIVKDDILVYFAIWLLGTAFSRIQLEAGAAGRCLLFAVLSGSAVYFRLWGHVDSQTLETFGQDLLFALIFVLWLSSMQFKAPTASRAYQLADRLAQFFASFSFTLYVLHVPLILVVRDFLPATLGGAHLVPDHRGHYLVYATVLAVIVLASYLLYLPFESNTQRLRSWIKKLLAVKMVRVGV
jgi:peptidoglycan/LPS O-acetylase OafA/YrhL